ncbi:MAG: hypothetical protein CL483_12905 [Acidobacteria bacterium]|nr:hypothetical protein [Acidobacteriota bacterium]|tara:strand:- start:7152 stop:7535 length:384 start_codon:yes stop_codon:yes gene_type:complete
MADQTGEYNLKYSGTVVNKTADGQVQQLMTYEGAGTGFPVILGSLIFTMPLSEAGANSGSCSWAGRGVLDDGTLAAGLAEGTWERIGDELRANVSLVHEVSNGQKIRSEGVLDFNAGTFNGQMYAIE